MTKFQTLTTVLAGALLLAACDEAVVGGWQSKPGFCVDEQKDTLTIDADLAGTGTIIVACDSITEAAVACSATLSATETWQERWTIEARFGFCEAMGRDMGTGYKECEERADGDELLCCDPDGRRCVEYIRTE